MGTDVRERGEEREVIADRFEILRRLGSGGTGVVYAAHDRERREDVALKFVVNVDPGAVLRLKHEFRVLADIRHPNLVKLHELLCAEGTWFFTMQLVDGSSLLEWVRGDERERHASIETITTAPVAPRDSRPYPVGSTPSGCADPERLRASACQLAQGIAHLHQHGCVHRDIKPANVLVDRVGRVVLCDFSIARTVEIHGVFPGDDLLAGTVPYMSPEQAAGKPQGGASDWYSFGVLLFECLTGRFPFVGDQRDVLTRKQLVPAPSVHDFCLDAPSDLATLCKRLLQIEPSQRPGAAEVLASFGQRTSSSSWTTGASSIVGREAELAQLDLALDEVTDGHAVTVLVHGEAGAGKSVLLKHFIERVSPRAVALFGRCYQRESVPFKAFDAIIDALSHYLAGLPRGDAEQLVPSGVAYLARLFPVLRRVRAIAAPPLPAVNVRSPQELQRRAFAALRELLGNIARHRPVVMAIDDVQWGDLDSARLLRELMNPPDAPLILVVVSFPSAERSSPMVAEMLRADVMSRATSRTLVVPPLDETAAHLLATRMLTGAAIPADVTSEVARESQGNPLLVGVLARWLGRHGSIGGIALDPDGLTSLLQARIAQLEPIERRILIAVAVAGRPLATMTALLAAELGEGDAGLAACAELRFDQFLRSCALRDGEDAVEVYHDRIRVAALASVEPDELRSWHERLARAAETVSVVDHEFLAEQWRDAGDRQQSASHAVEAAIRAAEKLAFGRAARLYRMALELAPDAATAAETRVALGDALSNAGRGAEAAEVWTVAAAEAPTAANALELRRRSAQQWLYTGHADRGLSAIRDVLGSIGLGLASTPRRALLGLVARRAWARLRGLRWKRRDASRVAPETLSRLDVYWAAATGLSMIDTIRGADFQTRHLALALRTGEPRRVARALAMESAYAATGGSRTVRRASELRRRAAAIADEIGDPQTTGFVRLIDGCGRFLLGEWAAAARTCLDAERILREQCTGVDWELTNAAVYALSSYGYMGDLATLRQEIPRRIREAEERGNRYMVGWVRCGIANLVLLSDGRDREIEAHVDEAISALRMPPDLPQFQVQHYFALWSRCQIAMFRGDGNAALRLVRETWPALERSLMLRVQYVRINATHLRARCALAAARSERDPSLAAPVAAAIRALRNEASPWAAALAEALAGGLAAVRGDASRATRSLDQAAAGLDAAGMSLFARSARLQAARVREDAVAIDQATQELMAAGVTHVEQIANVLVPC